jgi:hypothetical protein
VDLDRGACGELPFGRDNDEQDTDLTTGNESGGEKVNKPEKDNQDHHDDRPLQFSLHTIRFIVSRIRRIRRCAEANVLQLTMASVKR